LIVQLAEKYKKTPAQILLRWAVQQGVSVIPRTHEIGNLKEDIDILSWKL
jgi:diketogulonate reductase-like aldo/keto reductase